MSCSHEREGCDWSGRLGDYDAHSKVCFYEETTCPNGCKETVLNRDLDDHVKNKCSNRLVTCKDCDESIYFHELKEHPNSCGSVKVKCPNFGCKAIVCRGNLCAHSSVCPREELICPHENLGCETLVLRKDLSRHLLGNADMHLLLASKTVSQLEDELKETRKKLISAEAKLLSRRVPPATFIMNDYARLKSENQLWKSPAFFTHPNGYRMHIEVYPGGGPEEESREFLSLYFRMSSGPNDDNLIWPFRGVSAVEILNQTQNRYHHLMAINWATAGENVTQKPRSGSPWEVSEGWGLQKFISHTDLEARSAERAYVHNDSIYFRVRSVKVDSSCKSWLICSP